MVLAVWRRTCSHSLNLGCMEVNTEKMGSGPGSWSHQESMVHGLGEAVAVAAKTLLVACRAQHLKPVEAVGQGQLGAIVALELAWIWAARSGHSRHVALAVLGGVSVVSSPGKLVEAIV